MDMRQCGVGSIVIAVFLTVGVVFMSVLTTTIGVFVTIGILCIFVATGKGGKDLGIKTLKDFALFIMVLLFAGSVTSILVMAILSTAGFAGLLPPLPTLG